MRKVSFDQAHLTAERDLRRVKFRVVMTPARREKALKSSKARLWTTDANEGQTNHDGRRAVFVILDHASSELWWVDAGRADGDGRRGAGSPSNVPCELGPTIG